MKHRDNTDLVVAMIIFILTSWLVNIFVLNYKQTDKCRELDGVYLIREQVCVKLERIKLD